MTRALLTSRGCGRWPAVLLTLIWGLAMASPALAVTFTVDTLIAEGDTTYDGEDVVVDGCTVTINGAHAFNSLQVINGGVVTHSAYAAPTVYRLDLTIAEDVTVDTDSRIDVSGQGDPRDQGPGAGGSASRYGAGGGYGGKGGDSTAAAGGSAYGSITEPADLGSGGGRATGSSSYAGGAGGGAVRLAISGTLTVNGALVANGADGEGSGSYGVGGGSGGSIWLTVGSLAGAGVVTANGGNGGHANAGGGGGGRIAVYADSIPFEGTLSACGGAGNMTGGAGTLYTKLATDTQGTLLIDNCGTAGALTPSIATETFDRITVQRGGRLDLSGTELMTTPQLVIGNAGGVTLQTAATFGQVQIEEGGLLTHHAMQTGFELTVTGDLTIAAGGALDVSGQGHPRIQGPGAGSSASHYGAGGGYGGKGGDSTAAAGGSAYGSITEPADLGSGGGRVTGSSSYAGGAGGGAVRLAISGTLTVNGALVANGADGEGSGNYGVGGGSGGSIWLTVGTLAGAGVVTANGGNGGHANAGGGGGGRIAVYADSIPFEGTLSACGGGGNMTGGAGTLYTKLATDTQGTLLIDNCGTAGALTPSLATETFDRVTVQRGGRLDFSGTELMTTSQLVIGNAGRVTLQTAATFGQVLIEEGGLLTHHATQTGFELAVTGDLTIAAGGALDVSGQGYPRDQGPGAGGSERYSGAGGGYGGKGGDSTAVAGGSAYGSITEPADLGSGGGRVTGSSSYAGGAGGGAVRLAISGTLTVNGALVANGADGEGSGSYGVGGGSGGSIWLTVGTLAGAGVITANGGDCGNLSAGGGAGGRIAIYHGGMESFDPARITVTGGAGYQHGEDGTIYLSSINLPKALSHEPAGWLTAPVSHVDVTFDSFMKPWTFGPEDVLITTPGGGTISQAEITVSHVQGRVFRIAFPEQLAQDLYTVRVGPHIVNLYDQEMDQSGNGTPGEEWGDAYVGTFSVDTTPLLIEQAQSRKTHGTGGTYDLDVLMGTRVECRANGPTLLVVVFNQEIEGVDGLDLGDVSVTNATATSVAITGTSLEIGLSGAVDGSLVTVSFPGIVDVTEQYPVLVQDTLCFGALKGDANGDKSVNIFDLVTVRNALNQPVTAANFRGDVTADNAINIFDLVTVRNNLNKGIAGWCP